jgi:8-oxo-dGTP diphosphatase
MLKKPRRGWYAMPGGKMEQNETIKEAVIREFREETALNIHDPSLAGAFTFSIFEDDAIKNEWMMFTFISYAFDGKLTDHCEEGELAWIPLEQVGELPMAEGDKKIFEHIRTKEVLVYGSFSYTEDEELVNLRFDPPLAT